ncbi:FAD-dependent oxidoreductase [Nocardioides sp. YIM 152315]|uniref:FAD-dependent oxidoreductase n=1 Tax=Nocardioides sp. YIM 152315 TaxID=3031760 RepID=UPI0023DC0682|nr:FAD-dependent oxidoreductase [Nocardioides sp. YIM 152315]MDF1602219.1 FAD-dependent oxidoreductase [Nocardioides sp. YIM 152315]
MGSQRSVRTGAVGSAIEVGVPQDVDVVVIGSGGSGLMAALSAAADGATVLVLESEPKVGGTTAISGGAVWVPNHGLSEEILKAGDSPEAARTYLLGQGREQVLDPAVVDAFIETAPRVIRFVEEKTYLSWIPVVWPDYTSEIPGASSFRSLFPGPFPPELLGDAADLVRPPKKSGMARNPLPLWLINGIDGVWVAGYAMIGAFLDGCLQAGVDVRTDVRATRLVKSGDAVTGVVVETTAGEHSVRASKGVVIATGGFEDSDDLTSKYLGAPFPIQVSPQGHLGSALGMVEEVGADLVAMDQAWWQPGIQVPGEQLEGQAISRLVQGERALPHTIMVNTRGERFANEAVSYNDLGAVMRRADPVTGEMPNAFAWMIFDEYYHQHYSFLSVPPGGDYPANVLKADTLEELADLCGIDRDGLVRTVKEFNPEAAKGRDPWFNRGSSTFERFFGDHNVFLGRLSPNAWAPGLSERTRMRIAKAVGPVAGRVMGRIARKRDPERMRKRIVPVLTRIMRPCLDRPASGTLGPIDTAPYYAVKIETSAIGTIGGPRTDEHARVLDRDGKVIPGLYAAGNAGGAATQGFYGGAGGTITLGITFGYLAGRDAAAR